MLETYKEFRNLPKDHIKHVEILIGKFNSNKYWANDKLGEEALGCTSHMQINIILEAFIKYYSLYTDREFHGYIEDVFEIAIKLSGVIPRFSYFPKSNLMRVIAGYTYKLVCGKPGQKEKNERGVYLYRDNQSVSALIVHSSGIQEALNLSSLSNKVYNEDIFNNLEWPESSMECINLSKKQAGLITSNCEYFSQLDYGYRDITDELAVSSLRWSDYVPEMQFQVCQSFSDCISANYFCDDFSGDQFNEFIQFYVKENINLDWVNCYIIDSILLMELYSAVKVIFPSYKTLTEKPYDSDPAFNLLKKSMFSVIRLMILPTIALASYALDYKTSSLWILLFYVLQIVLEKKHSKSNAKYSNISSKYAKAFSIIVKLKNGLFPGLISVRNLLLQLKSLNETTSLNFNVLISFLYHIEEKESYLCAINRVTFGMREIKNLDKPIHIEI